MGTVATAHGYWVFTRGQVQYWACSIQPLSALLENHTALRTGQHSASDTKYNQIHSMNTDSHNSALTHVGEHGHISTLLRFLHHFFCTILSSQVGGAPVALLWRRHPSIPSPRAVEIPKPAGLSPVGTTLRHNLPWNGPFAWLPSSPVLFSLLSHWRPHPWPLNTSLISYLQMNPCFRVSFLGIPPKILEIITILKGQLNVISKKESAISTSWDSKNGKKWRPLN